MRKTFTLGMIGGLTAGLLLALGMVAYATWADPTSAPPTGGYLRVNTTGSVGGGCSEGGRLHFDESAGTLHYCDGTNWQTVATL